MSGSRTVSERLSTKWQEYSWHCWLDNVKGDLLLQEVMGLSTHELEGAHEVLSDQENSCAPSPACSSPLPR